MANMYCLFKRAINKVVESSYSSFFEMAVCQNLVPLVNIKIAGKWMFIPLKMVLIGIDPYSNLFSTLANILNRARFFTVQALLGVASEAWTLPGDRDPILCLSIAS